MRIETLLLSFCMLFAISCKQRQEGPLSDEINATDNASAVQKPIDPANVERIVVVSDAQQLDLVGGEGVKGFVEDLFNRGSKDNPPERPTSAAPQRPTGATPQRPASASPKRFNVEVGPNNTVKVDGKVINVKVTNSKDPNIWSASNLPKENGHQTIYDLSELQNLDQFWKDSQNAIKVNGTPLDRSFVRGDWDQLVEYSGLPSVVVKCGDKCYLSYTKNWSQKQIIVKRSDSRDTSYSQFFREPSLAPQTLQAMRKNRTDYIASNPSSFPQDAQLFEASRTLPIEVISAKIGELDVRKAMVFFDEAKSLFLRLGCSGRNAINCTTKIGENTFSISRVYNDQTNEIFVVVTRK